MKLKSWRTTILGLCQFAVVLVTAVRNALDGDPSTVVNVEFLAASAATAWALFVARDNVVSSASQGVK